MKYIDNIVLKESNLNDALKKLDSLPTKCLVVVDDDNNYYGTVTDGDIRRYTLQNDFIALNSKIELLVNLESLYILKSECKGMLNFQGHKGLLLPILEHNKVVNIVKISSAGFVSFCDAVIMAGGRGTRLMPYTENCPKPLVNISSSKRLINLQLDLLVLYGFQNVFIIANQFSEQIVQYFNEHNFDCSVSILVEHSFLGTCGALFDFSDCFESDIFLINCDVYTDLDIYQMYLHFKEFKCNIDVAVLEKNNYIDFGVIEGDRYIAKLIEKPTFIYLINTGIYWIGHSVLNSPRNKVDGLYHMTDEIQYQIDNDNKVGIYRHFGLWKDIGRVEDLDAIKKIMKYDKN